MFQMPSAAITKNQIKVTGPNKLPTVAVPYFWITKRQNRIATAIGIMNCFSAGVAISIPSTADNTEIAGVMTDSPINMQAPSMPRIIKRKYSFVPLLTERSANAIKDKTPPSPLLSARITNKTYLKVTTKIKAQIIIEMTP